MLIEGGRGHKNQFILRDYAPRAIRSTPVARFIGATGAATICLSWLKTINGDYRAVAPPLKSPAKAAAYARRMETKGG